MPRSRRSPRAGVVSALALLCAASLAASCGDAQPGSGSAGGPARTAGAAAAVPAPGAGANAAAGGSTAAQPVTGGPRAREATRAARGAGETAAGGGRRRSRAHRPIPPAHPVPAAFRPAAGAPSDAQVERELAQLGTIQRQERERALSAAAANLAGLLPWTDEPKSGVQVSVASVFRDYGLGLACGGLLGRFQIGVAHKTAPCGTLITFTYNHRSLIVPVIDRGPFIAGREWDLTGATADALGFPGLGQIAWALAR